MIPSYSDRYWDMRDAIKKAVHSRRSSLVCDVILNFDRLYLPMRSECEEESLAEYLVNEVYNIDPTGRLLDTALKKSKLNQKFDLRWWEEVSV